MLKSPLSSDELARLNIKQNLPSAWRLAVHIGLLATLGWGACQFVDEAVTNPVASGWLYLPALLCLLGYGAVFNFLGYAGLGHELAHYTVFKARWLNVALFRLVSVLTWNNPEYFRTSHRVPHQHTLELGVDYEVNPAPYPLLERWWRYAFFDWEAMQRALTIHWENARNVVNGPFGQRHFPAGSANRQKLVRTARIHIALQGTAASVSLALGWWAGLVLGTIAPFICTLPNRILAKLQHAGLARDSHDHRQSTRTVLLAKPFALLYWNMNYHVEHHMHPSVPHFNLPKLREALGTHLKSTTPGVAPHLHSLRMPTHHD